MWAARCGGVETVLQPLSMGPIVSEATALGVSESTVTNFLVPVNVQSHPLYNPDLDYSVYLSHPFFFILFQVLILLVTVFMPWAARSSFAPEMHG